MVKRYSYAVKSPCKPRSYDIQNSLDSSRCIYICLSNPLDLIVYLWNEASQKRIPIWKYKYLYISRLFSTYYIGNTALCNESKT